MRFLTRSALKRLAVLFVIIAGIILWCWWSMIRMPLKSFRGPLPALSPEQGTVRDALRRNFEKIAGEKGERYGCKPDNLRAAAYYGDGICTNAGYKSNRQP